MKRIKKVFQWVHLFAWILFGLLVSLQLKDDPNWPVLTATLVLTCLYVFYGHFFLLKRYPGKKKKAAYFTGLAVVILIAPFIYLIFYENNPGNANSFFDQYLIYQVSFVLPFIFLAWLARATENLVINSFKKEQLEKQAVENELYYLKSQINPHFLFNTLNNIHTLVYKQASAAPEAVMQLASLMRYMIYESNAPTVPLTREMEYLQDYVSLQQLRYKQKPVVDLKILGETEGCYIAPLLFIHLLENAYKHSPATLSPGDIKVLVEVKDNTLCFSVKNPVGKRVPNKLDEPGGIGLSNARKRLALLYPRRHAFEINNTGETFAVVLQIHDLHLQPHEQKADLLYHRR